MVTTRYRRYDAHRRYDHMQKVRVVHHVFNVNVTYGHTYGQIGQAVGEAGPPARDTSGADQEVPRIVSRYDVNTTTRYEHHDIRRRR